MISKEYTEAIEIIVKRFHNSNIEWYLAGKTNLALQGIDIIPSQVGIVIHYEDLDKFLDIFSEFKKTEIEELVNGEAKEFIMTISNVSILVCAEYLHGAYWVVNKSPIKIEIANLEIPCFSLESEREAYTKIGLSEKARIIYDFLEKEKEQMVEKAWCVYILECLDGSYYTGVTNDVEKRMKAHKSKKGSKYVMRHGFSHLIATKPCKDKSDACKAEYWIKQLPRSEKLNTFKE